MNSETQASRILVVGQGIAGSILAFHLEQGGFQVKICSDPQKVVHSKVAGGMFNPIYGKDLALSWKAQLLFPYLNEFYPKLELFLQEKLGKDISFFHKTGLYRKFLSQKQENDFYASEDQAMAQFMAHESFDEKVLNEVVKPPISGFFIENAGWVDSLLLLEVLEEYFVTKDLIIDFTTDYSAFDRVVFARGYEESLCPEFSWLPFNPAKGEIINYKYDKSWGEFIINSGIFSIPLSANEIRVGATYSWDDLDHIPTDAARDELSQKTEKMLLGSLIPIKHLAGVRPATQDRRPFVGQHPENPKYFIFNGFGSKGISLSPFFAGQLTAYFKDQSPIDPGADIARYYSYFNKAKKSS